MLARLYLKYCVLFWSPSYRKYAIKPESVKRRFLRDKLKWIKGIKNWNVIGERFNWKTRGNFFHTKGGMYMEQIPD